MPFARSLLVRGLIAGLIAGVMAFAVAYAIGEPPIEQAIALEEADSTAPSGEHDHQAETPGHAESADSEGHTHGEGGETEVSRDLQSTAGLLTGFAVVGTVLGGLAGIATALAYGRIGRSSIRLTALVVAASGFVVLYLVPYLVYPPNPPAVGDGETIGQRTGAYFTVLALSVLAALAAAAITRALQSRWDSWVGGLAGVASYAAAMVLVISTMPRYDEVGTDFPAQLLYDFRLSSLLTQAALWAFIGILLADLAGRAPGARRSAATDRHERDLVAASPGSPH